MHEKTVRANQLNAISGYGFLVGSRASKCFYEQPVAHKDALCTEAFTLAQNMHRKSFSGIQKISDGTFPTATNVKFNYGPINH